MRYEFLYKNNSQNLILFFGGFGFLPKAYATLKSNNNVIIIYDYSKFNLDFLNECKNYQNIILLSYSMGAMVASKCDFSNFNIIQKIAINGTSYGIHKEFGINERIFKLSALNFNLDDFLKKAGANNLKDYFASENTLKNELLNILEISKMPIIWQNYDLAYSSNEDAIFPQKALINCFNNIIFMDKPHFCFNNFNSWEEICMM
ncbi:pimeloyl-ACP methyl esterase BioG family protein [Campylobacter sp. MG1]|uniref:pimeloyl-ACP methyl esterase BioG family protein n=1 Tax=Campylobacter sp. MG1 TaxID=2976332 RepID=UPI00226C9812|nr:pimeloyl-ACP methyl esterase BioG family protein [Campylobacter sp. MG1]